MKKNEATPISTKVKRKKELIRKKENGFFGDNPSRNDTILLRILFSLESCLLLHHLMQMQVKNKIL